MKKRYLCPVCDQELTAKRYCPECRRVRKEPVVYEGWLLPNESDGEGVFQRAAEGASARAGSASASGGKAVSGKASASGGKAVSGKASASGGNAAGRRVQSGGRVYDSRYLDNCGSDHAHAYGAPNRDPHKAKRGAKGGMSLKGFKILVILTIICSAAAALWEPLWEVGKEIVTDIQEEFGIGDSRDGPEEALDALESGENGAEVSGNGLVDNYTTLSEEEVKAAGEPCNGYAHYDVDGEEYIARLSQYINDLWPEEAVSFEWQESYNQVYQNGSSRYSYYERRAECFLGNGVYYIVSCDTVTGEVMELSVGAEGEEEFGRAFLLMTCALEPEKDRNGVWSEIQSLFSAMEGEEYYFGDWGIHEIYLSGGTSYYGSLKCLPQYDKYQ
ncbi:MAG: hypothetical protein HFI64_00180 [Lachnospiraceae bacterium]|nr:hypothetical protein [Lachnospiraceae bacterium]